MHVLVTGAGNGLGHAFVRAFCQHSDTVIHAIDRTFFKPLPPACVGDLRATTLDITDEKAVSSYGERLTHYLSERNERLSLVIHSAGVRGLVPSVEIEQSSDVANAETMHVMDAATLLTTYEINAAGTFQTIKALLPSLRLSPSKLNDHAQPALAPKVVVMGSRMGSIGSNSSLGGAYAYRASKAAVNAIVKSFSIDVPEVTFLVVHPGRVETGLVSVKEDGALSVEQSVEDLLKLIERCGLEHSGSFLDLFGAEIPW